jgi:hypothetical protein
LRSTQEKRRVAAALIFKNIKAWLIRKHIPQTFSFPQMSSKKTVANSHRKYSHNSEKELVKKRLGLDGDIVIIRCCREKELIRKLDSVPITNFNVWKMLMGE